MYFSYKMHTIPYEAVFVLLMLQHVACPQALHASCKLYTPRRDNIGDCRLPYDLVYHSGHVPLDLAHAGTHQPPSLRLERPEALAAAAVAASGVVWLSHPGYCRPSRSSHQPLSSASPRRRQAPDEVALSGSGRQTATASAETGPKSVQLLSD